MLSHNEDELQNRVTAQRIRQRRPATKWINALTLEINHTTRPPGKAVLLVIATAVAAWRLIDWNESTLDVIGRLLFDQTPLPKGGPPPTMADTMATAARCAVDLAAAAVVLVCLAIVGGSQAVGIRRRPRAETLRAVAYLLQLPMAVTTTGVVAASTLLAFLPAANDAVAEVAEVADPPSPWWFVLLRAATAGIAEEIIATVLVYWLLKRIPGPGRRPLADTWIGTALIVGVHLSYHLYYGIAVLGLVPTIYLLWKLWQRTKNLPILAAGHAAIDCVAWWIDPAGFTALGGPYLFIKVVVLVLVGSAVEAAAKRIGHPSDDQADAGAVQASTVVHTRRES